MNTKPRRFKAGDPCPDRPGFVFLRYIPNGNPYFATVEQYTREKKNAREYQKKRYANPVHREKMLKATKAWCQKPGSRERKQGLYSKWINNPEGRKMKREHARKWRASVNGTIINRVRSRIWQALKKGFTKSASTLELVGCSMSDFRNHLESQFKDGMSWDNVGKWEIDHITPLSVFDLSDPKQQTLAFRFTNCRPVWKLENRSKSDKIDGELFRGRELRKVIQFNPQAA